MSLVDKKLLKRLKILYVEDDTSARNELSSLLSNFFESVYTAQDGKIGLDLYKQKQQEIDVIVTDINMPELSGIEMLKEIRTFDKDVPVIFTTAYSDNDFLFEAIKLKVYEYIIKPIDIRKFMMVLNELATTIYKDFLLNQQNKELQQYKDIIYNYNIVIRTNKNMQISFVNDVYCQTTGFNKKELLGKELIFLKHKDTNTNIYNSVVNNNNKRNIELKFITKDGSYYIADTNIISTLNDNGEVTGCLVIQKDETKKALQRREVQSSLIRDKGEIFIKSKENNAEYLQAVNILKDEVSNLKKEVDTVKKEKDQYIYTAEKYTLENKRLKLEVKQYKKDFSIVTSQHAKSIKLSKDNSNYLIELKRLNLKLFSIKEDHEKECKQIRVNYEVKLGDLEQELEDIKNKLDNVDNIEAIAQKLSYWKEKAKSEAKKIEKLERDIINHGDTTIMDKLFGSR